MIQNNQNAVVALLSEYEKAITELVQVIDGLSNKDLEMIVDRETQNAECESIQSILTHVISSGYSYCVYIENHRNIPSFRPESAARKSVSEYQNDLRSILDYARKTFADIPDSDLEEFDNSKKMLTSWNQLYDIEQLMEHAIVHILRHRRQIEKFRDKINASA